MNLCFLHPIPARRFWKPSRSKQPMQDNMQDNMQNNKIWRSDRSPAIRKLEHLYFLERRGLL